MDGKVLLVDDSKCTGCLLCSIACSIRHTADIALDRAHVKVWCTSDERFVPLTCHHCEVASCVLACPTKACHRDEATQRVLIDERKCIGCEACVVGCPFGHAHFDHVARISVKCDYCDGDPECVRVCEAGAIVYVDADETAVARRHETPLARAEARRRGIKTDDPRR